LRGKSEGLYLYTRHSPDCQHCGIGDDRDQSRRCNCVKYIGGRADDGMRLRKSSGTTSWEKARKLLAAAMDEHDPLKQKLRSPLDQQPDGDQVKTIEGAIERFLQTKRGESVKDMAHYEGLFKRELLTWCKEQGLFDITELDLDQVTQFRNQLANKGTVKNRKVSRLRNFFEFCQDRHWIDDNPARRLKPANEEPPAVDYFTPEEMQKLLQACFISHSWERGRDFEYRDRRLHALLLFMRWTGLSIIDCIRFERNRMQQNADGVWFVMLHRQKNGNPVFVAIPQVVADAMLTIPAMSDTYFFWSGNGKPETAVRGWRRSVEHVFKAAKLKHNGKPVRCHLHMFRHTFAIEKLLAGAPLEDVSLLLAHHSIKITERHYLKFDSRRQERLTAASMVDWSQVKPAKRAASRKVVSMKRKAAGGGSE
jgi:integrase/recombinase XerD